MLIVTSVSDIVIPVDLCFTINCLAGKIKGLKIIIFKSVLFLLFSIFYSVIYYLCHFYNIVTFSDQYKYAC